MLDIITRPSEQVKSDTESADNADNVAAEQGAGKVNKKTISEDKQASDEVLKTADIHFNVDENGQLSLF